MPREEPTHEVPVDLQVAEGQALGVVEGAEADSEVVECDRAAERLHALAECTGTPDVGDRGGLGDLDDQATRIDSVASELGLDVSEHPAIGDRERREIQRDAAGVSPRAALRELPSEQAGDPTDD